MPIYDEAPDPVELEINPERVVFIIDKAHEFDVKVSPDFSDAEAEADEEEERLILEDYKDDPTLQELRDAINGLNEDEVIDLIAIAWVGRGDFTRTEWDEARTLAAERHRRQSADYLVGIPLLADFLEDGLEELGYDIEDYASGESG